jgi:predicted lactoylglutathione lyase
MDTKKISETELEVTKEIFTPIKTEKVVYERDFIKNQIIDITKQRDEMIALKEKELAECQDILAKMDEQGIVSKPVDTNSLPVEEKVV